MAQGSAPPNVTARLWDRLVEQADDNLGIQLVRFDRALEADDGTRLRQALDSISQLDRAGGIAGTSARTAAATYSIWEARKTGNLDQLPKVLDDLRGLARDRAGWSKIPLAEALIFELQKKPDSAIEKYRRAVELGERDPEALRRLIELLYEQKQFAAANAVYRLLPEGTAASPEFQLLAAKVSLQNRDFGRALALAAKAVPDDSKDYKKLIWRGRILWMTGNMIKAKQPLLRAKDLAPDQPAPWIALVAYYASRGPDFKPEIDKLLDEAKAKINKADAPLALAQCYESIGRPDLAKPYIEQDLKNRPNDVHVLSAAATLRLRENDFDGAEKLLLQILTADSVKKTPEDVRAAKQRLAFIMSYNRGDYEESRQKLERMGLLDQRQISRKLTGSETADEIRDRAVTLAIQPDLSSKREAIRLLVEFAAWQDLRAEDQFLLAHLHNVTGDWPQARVVLASLIQAQGEEANPLYVAYMALNLIRNSDAEAADKLVARLEKDKLQGEALRTIELRARLLAATGHADAARKLLLEQLNKPNPRLAAIASLLEQTDSGAAAEPLYKQIVAGSKRPEAVLALAAYYGRQYRAAEALALCDQAWKSAKPEAVAEASVAVLYAARVPKPDDMAHVAGRLEEALRQNPGSPTLLGTMAAVLNLRGDYTRAIAVYRQVCDRDPKDALARNNLAFLLAAHGGEYDKALAELERAKKMVGAIPMLLDTEAQIYLAKKDPAKAVERLKEAIALEPSGANYFHLAQAYHASNKELDARVAWGQAQKRKLKPADLHSLERPAYQKLAAEFAAP
jgi:tetratricopeptide (TPR) repeat protein